jgi:hypothetical protein
MSASPFNLTDRLLIDGKDAYVQWGVYVTEQGYNDLIAWPPLKTPESNDWQEEDGVDPDLDDTAKFDTREAQLKLAVTGADGRLWGLLEHLADGPYHTFTCASIGREYRLRLTSMPNLSEVTNLGIVTLKLSDDLTAASISECKPVGSPIADSDEYEIDGVALTEYGVRCLSGTLASIRKAPEVKKNLLRSIKTQQGVLYDAEDGATVTYKSREVTLKCLMRADTLAQLWANWDALCYACSPTERHLLYVREVEQEFAFYYKKCSVTRFYPTDRIWLEFSLTLVFYEDSRIDDSMFLATEDGTRICTEESYPSTFDDTTFIDLTPNK